KTFTPIQRHEAINTNINIPDHPLYCQSIGAKPTQPIIWFATDESDSAKTNLKIIPATTVDVRVGINNADRNIVLNFTTVESNNTARIIGIVTKITTVNIM